MTNNDKTQAIEWLKTNIKPGDTIYTILRHVSSSGMTRGISAYAIVDGELTMIDWNISHAANYKFHKKGGLKVEGCGMDMGFDLVYNLALVLWPIGNGKYVTGRNGDTTPETDGGYLLKQQWL